MKYPRTIPGSILIPVAALVLLFSPRSANACSCVAPGSPYEELQRSDLVFVGRVMSITTSDDDDYAHLKVSLLRVRTFGAAAGSGTVTIRTATNSAACGFSFSKGRHYLVYASESDGQLWTHLCTRTASVSQAREDLISFNAGALARLDDQSPRCGGPTGAAAIQSALMVVGLVLVRRFGQSGKRTPDDAPNAI